jgi:antitoxin component YwqK of YwqJK toxin-antitoxin module
METKVERKYWSSGELCSETPYVDGVRHGLQRSWRQNGELWSERPYVDGELHGMDKWWHRNGDIDEFWLWNQNELVAKFYPRNQTQRWKLK